MSFIESCLGDAMVHDPRYICTPHAEHLAEREPATTDAPKAKTTFCLELGVREARNLDSPKVHHIQER